MYCLHGRFRPELHLVNIYNQERGINPNKSLLNYSQAVLAQSEIVSSPSNPRSIPHLNSKQVDAYETSRLSQTILVDHNSIESKFSVYNFSDSSWKKQHNLFCRSKEEKVEAFVKGELLGSGSFGKVYALNETSFSASRKALKESDVESMCPELLLFIRLHEINTKGFTGIELFPKAILFNNRSERAIKIMSQYDGNLSDLIAKGLSVLESRDIILQITEGLTTLHRYKIIHGDLAERNIFHKIKNGTVRYDLCDFGLSRNRDDNVERNKIVNIKSHNFVRCYNKKLNQQICDDTSFHKERRFDVRNYLALMHKIMDCVGKHNFTSKFGEFLDELSSPVSFVNIDRLRCIKILHNVDV
jgi:hypothetical protein